MTEEEAKTKWCPFMRVKPDGLAPDPRVLGDVTCVGSACMMWRWYHASVHGYCGLAGKS